MTRDEKRCLRTVHGQISEIGRELMWIALAGQITLNQRTELVAALRAAADRMERNDD